MKIRKPLRKSQIPSLFTLINMFLGFLAIISVADGYYERAAYLILWAAIFDALDGKLARKFGVPTDFGGELDSLADVVSFCLAPSFMIWAIYARDMNPVIGALIAGAPLYMGALRLARFNVSQSDKPLPYFEGLPAPMAAFGLVGLVLYYAPTWEPGAAKVVMPAVIVISILMVSRVRYMKAPQLSLKAGAGNTFFMLASSITLLLVIFVNGKFLLPMISLFILTGIVRYLTRTDSAADFRSIKKDA